MIDDESDYFNIDGNKWLNPNQRDALRAKEKELREKRFGSRRGAVKVTLDFAGMKCYRLPITFIKHRYNDGILCQVDKSSKSKIRTTNYSPNKILTKIPKTILKITLSTQFLRSRDQS